MILELRGALIRELFGEEEVVGKRSGEHLYFLCVVYLWLAWE